MKIDPPDRFKGPEQPQGPERPEKASGVQGSGFQGKIDEAQGAGRADSTRRADGPRTTELRQVLQGVDKSDPERLKHATDRMVDWVLKDSFGDAVLQAKGSEGLLDAIREQLLNDPVEASRIQKIIERL